MKEILKKIEIESKEIEIQKNSTPKKYWSCGACGGSSSTGCLSSTGECYR